MVSVVAAGEKDANLTLVDCMKGISRLLTQSLYSMAILSSRRLHILPLVIKLRTSRFGIHALHRVLAVASLGLVGIPLELSSISFLRLAR